MKRLIFWIIISILVTVGILTGINLYWDKDGVSWVGNFASVFGLSLTLYVAHSVWVIEHSYIRQAILPKYVSKLKAHLKNLDRELKEKNAQKLLTQLSLCQAILKGVSNHFPNRTEAEKLSLELDSLLKRPDTDIFSRCERLLGKLYGELESIEMLKFEMQWRRRDAN